MPEEKAKNILRQRTRLVPLFDWVQKLMRKVVLTHTHLLHAMKKCLALIHCFLFLLLGTIDRLESSEKESNQLNHIVCYLLKPRRKCLLLSVKLKGFHSHNLIIRAKDLTLKIIWSFYLVNWGCRSNSKRTILCSSLLYMGKKILGVWLCPLIWFR